MIKVVVSIVSYGAPQIALRCIESLVVAAHYCADKVSLDIYVVDNFLCEEYTSELAHLVNNIEQVKYRPQRQNLGFAGGHNIVIREALSSGDTNFIWLLNSDCIVAEDCLIQHVSVAMDRRNIHIWGSTLLEAEGEVVQCAGGCFYNPWLTTAKNYCQSFCVTKIEEQVEPKFDYIAGASMFFPTGTIKKLRQIKKNSRIRKTQATEYLNEDYFLYFEELDLSMRLGQGRCLGWCKSAKVIHVGGESVGTNVKRTKLAEFYSTLSALKYTWLYHRFKFPVAAVSRFISKSVLLVIVGKPRLVFSIFRAYYAFILWVTDSKETK